MFNTHRDTGKAKALAREGKACLLSASGELIVRLTPTKITALDDVAGYDK